MGLFRISKEEDLVGTRGVRFGFGTGKECLPMQEPRCWTSSLLLRGLSSSPELYSTCRVALELVPVLLPVDLFPDYYGYRCVMEGPTESNPFHSISPDIGHRCPDPPRRN